MPYPDSLIKHAAVEGRAGKIDTSAVPPRRRLSRDRAKLTWASAAVAEKGDTTVEVDEAIETDAWKLSIDMPVCHISLQIEGKDELEELLEFLRRADPAHPLEPFGEFRIPRSSTILVWDDEAPGRLFIWLSRTGKNSIRAELSQHQIGCIRSALTEATRPG
jgi:hypothetical protein